jgi:hypothetical protein
MMTKLVTEHFDEILGLCKKYKVRKLEVFGSATDMSRFDQDQSDLDFLVEFKSLEQGQHAMFYFGLLEDLKKIFNREIDLVMPKAIKNPYFLDSVNQNREVIYAA